MRIPFDMATKAEMSFSNIFFVKFFLITLVLIAEILDADQVK